MLQDPLLPEVAALKLPVLPSCRPNPSRQGPHRDPADRMQVLLPALRAMPPGRVDAGLHHSAPAHHCRCRRMNYCRRHHGAAGWPKRQALLLPPAATGHFQVLTLRK